MVVRHCPFCQSGQFFPDASQMTQLLAFLLEDLAWITKD